jgi:hypothetical protein
MTNARASRRLGAVAAATSLALVAACGGGHHGPRTTTSVVAPQSTGSTATAATTPATAAVPADAGTWSLIPNSPNPVGRPVVWTGKEIFVARAGCCDDLGSVDFAAYNPRTASWRRLPPTPLTPRFGAAGVWTGTELIVAGGTASSTGSHELAAAATDGAVWNAAANAWRPIAAMPVPLPGEPTAVWTGREVLVWASRPDNPVAKGAEVVLAYDPAANRWRILPSSGLTPRQAAVTVWTGTELVVWGGLNQDLTNAFGDGARLDPATNTWRRLPAAPVTARGMSASAWSGREVLVWGGVSSPGTQVGQGVAYDPGNDRWRVLPSSTLRAKSQAAGVWTGRLFVIIGGAAGASFPAPGPGAAAYDPSTNTWTALPPSPAYPPEGYSERLAADQRADGTAIWTGRAVVLVGGLDFRRQGPRNDGIVWTPRAATAQ